MLPAVDLVGHHSLQLVLVGIVQMVLLGEVQMVDQQLVEGAHLAPMELLEAQLVVQQELGHRVVAPRSSKNPQVVELEVSRLSEVGGGGQQPLEQALGAMGGGSNGTTEPWNQVDLFLGSPQ
ncbi:uncharacterized protein [Hetaerina americana]|uniref:uncharacterized protein n=1 Tax=Hetaerina americana TaxID=62018 RepID=UPI003A7F2F30